MAWSKLGAGEPQRPLAAPSLSLPSLAGCRGEQGIRSVPVLLQEQGHDQGRIHLLLQAPDEAVDRARPLLPAAEGTPAPLACSPVPLRAGALRGQLCPRSAHLPFLQSVTVETPQGTTYEGKRFHRQRVRCCPGPLLPVGTQLPCAWWGLTGKSRCPQPGAVLQGCPGSLSPSHGVCPSTVGLHGNCRASGERLGPELGPRRHGRAGQGQAGRG